MSVYWGFATRMAVDALRGRNVHLALLSPGYIQEDGHTYFSDVATWEVSGSGYPSGGVPVVLDAYYQDHAVIMDCGPVAFGLLGVSDVSAAVFYDNTGNPATSRLLAADVFPDGPVSVAGEQFTYLSGGISLTLAETLVDTP